VSALPTKRAHTCVRVPGRFGAERRAPFLFFPNLGSHRRRDVRCAVVAPKLEHGPSVDFFFLGRRNFSFDIKPTGFDTSPAFSQTLQGEGWDVHTQLEEPTGPPLEAYPDEDDKEAELNRRLQELDEGLPKRALILKTSHIGGHRYAGNVIVRCSSQHQIMVHWALMDAARCIDLHASRCWRMVRPCNDTRGRVHRPYNYSRRTDITSITARGRQPRTTRLQTAQRLVALAFVIRSTVIGHCIDTSLSCVTLLFCFDAHLP
jgi:hypothetical protein